MSPQGVQRSAAAHLPSGQVVVCRSGVSEGPRILCLFCPSYFRLSCVCLIEFLPKIYVQMCWGNVIGGRCPCRHDCTVLRYLPVPATSPARTVAALPHTHWSCLPFVSSCARNMHLPLCLLNLHIYRVQYILPGAFMTGFAVHPQM